MVSPHGAVSGTESESDDDDDLFDEDLEALRRACLVTGTDPASTGSDDSDSDDDDLELLRSVEQQLSIHRPLSLLPLSHLPPNNASDDDDDDDDFETLRAIQSRFASYTHTTFDEHNDLVHKPDLPTAPSKDDFNYSSKNVHQSDVTVLSTLPLESSSFPKSAHMFFDAIKKNRLCQKFVRSKLVHVEARIEENKNLKERFKILKDYQTACRRRTGFAFTQKKDPRAQLISAQKAFPSKIDDKKVSGMYYGPAENSHVSNYRMALTKYPLSLERKRWSDSEKENLGKGIKQQFQEMMLQLSIDQYSRTDVSAEESNSIDSILETIKDHEISLDHIREFLPKVNWDKLASMYVSGRSGAECEARWLNCEDPSINNSSWTSHEDKNLLLIIQETGISNWFNIAASLRTNRTPFQCLARYQRSLNACILKREWTKEEDDQLRIAVETFGESDWQAVASTLEGRAGTQCSNRWKKSLHPSRRQTGRWASDEDKRLKVAVMLFGPRNWKKIGQFVPGRTPVQCRERWVNSLDPSLKWGEWTEEEDSRLREAIVEHGYCWSKVAACVPPRTDSQCSRRWKVLVPDDVPLLREAKRIKKAIPGNFVDRESERPALGPKDFSPMATCSIPASESVNSARKCKRKRRLGAESYKEDAASSRKKKRAPRKPSSNNMDTVESGSFQNEQDTDNHSLVLLPPDCLELGTANGCGIEASTSVTTSSKKKKRAPRKPLRGNMTTGKSGILRNQQDMDNQDLVIPPACLESGTASGHGSGASNGAITSSISKKRAPKKPLRRNLRTEESGILRNQQDLDNQGLLLPSDCLESGIANGHGVEASNGATTGSISKKRAPKKPLRRNLRTEESGIHRNQQDMDNQGLLLPSDCLESGIANGHGVEASNGATTGSISKKRAPKKPLRRNLRTEESGIHRNQQDMDNQGLLLPSDCLESGIANGHGVEASNGVITSSISKKRAPKKPLKSNISTKKSANLENRQVMNNHSNVLPPGCLKLGTSRSGFEDSHGAITAPRKSRKAPKKPSRNIMASGDLQNHEEAADILMSPGTNQGFDVVPDLSCPQSPPLAITNGEEVQLIGWDATAGEKRAPKLHSRQKMSKKPPKAGNAISSTPVSSEVMINDGDHVECHFIDKVASGEKHCTLQQHHSGNNVTETSVENHDFVSMTPQKGIRKLKLGRQSLSNQNKETAHIRGDKVLACSVPKPSTMSRFDAPERASQGCSGLHSRLNRASEEHQMLLNSGTKVDERPPKKLQVYTRRRFRRQACCDGGAPESFSHKVQS